MSGEIPVNLGSCCCLIKGRDTEVIRKTPPPCGTVRGAGRDVEDSRQGADGWAGAQTRGRGAWRGLKAFRLELRSLCHQLPEVRHPRLEDSPPPWGFVSFCLPLSVIQKQIGLIPAASVSPAPTRTIVSPTPAVEALDRGCRTDSKSKHP